MVLRRDTDYAIQLLVYYARVRDENDRFVFRREVLRATDIPAEAQRRVCRILQKNGLLDLESQGRDAGYRLAVRPDDITLKGVIELTENGIDLLSVFDKRTNVYSHTALKKLQERLNRDLEAITIRDLTE